jgi:glucose/mannose-6-phosphate isomerase
MTIFEMIKEQDKNYQFDVLRNSYQQIQYSWNKELSLSQINTNKITNIVVTGLGGSSMGGELLSNFLKDELKVPYFVNRNYELPLLVNENSLVIASSYSGNTEETINALKEASLRKAQVVCITTGGEVEKICKREKIPYFELQRGFQPRFALWGNFFALLKIIESLKFVASQGKIVLSIIELLKSKGEELSKEANKALEIAEKLNGYIPVIYSVSDFTSSVGTRFKCQVNENSKLHAFCNLFPEMNHNEIIGWETVSEAQIKCKAVFIYDDSYNSRIKKRFEIVSDLIKQSGTEVITLKSDQAEYKLRLMDLIFLGDFISYYLAVIRRYDPSTIKNINYLKEKLAI